MNTSIKTTGIAGLLFTFGVALAAPIAHADYTDDFIEYLDRNGVNTSTPTIRQSDIDLGEAICGLYDAHVDQGDSRKVTNDDAVDSMTGGTTGNSSEQAAMWVVGSVDYLCPRYKWMM